MKFVLQKRGGVEEGGKSYFIDGNDELQFLIVKDDSKRTEMITSTSLSLWCFEHKTQPVLRQPRRKIVCSLHLKIQDNEQKEAANSLVCHQFVCGKDLLM